MKTAISIPDSLYRHANQAAERWNMSRSRLFSRAVEEYLENHDAQMVTEKLDTIFTREESRLDPALAKAQSKILDGERW